MKFINIFILEIIIFLLLLRHSFLLRGKRITLSFFFSAFLWMAWKETGIGPLGGNKSIPNMYPRPYEILLPGEPRIIGTAFVIIGWIIVFYISWCLAEQMLKRIDAYSNKIFAVLLFSGIVSMCLSNQQLYRMDGGSGIAARSR